VGFPLSRIVGLILPIGPDKFDGHVSFKAMLRESN
jgi:hypothetical protein